MNKTHKIPTVLIAVSGGVVQEVVSDSSVNIVVVDWDNIEDGQTDKEFPYPCLINKKRIKEVLKEANDVVKKNGEKSREIE